MCGIVGLFHYGRAEPVSREKLLLMRDSMIHRGPDDAGIYINTARCIGLGHRRLSIIDLSELGRQPMADESGTIQIVFNGEIYNYRELRADLEREGVRFRSHSDTEVLIHLYKKHGKGMLDRLRGMFGFAIWDEVHRSLFLARDRIGVKPVYYYNQGGVFGFASEIKALLRSGDIQRSVNPEAFYHYLSFLTTPAPQTLFDGIFKLAAGHWLTLDSTGHLELAQWWSPLSGERSAGSEDDHIERVRHLLKESIRYRMVSDVPFGVFLSGGIDSSTNVALMAEQMDRPVQTFSIGFRHEEQYNELEFARLVSERYKTDHHEILIDVDDLIDFLPQLVFHQDEPIADPVCIPVYFVAKLAKDHGVTVCQVGEGSDELFCGYNHWSYVLSLERLRRAYSMMPRPLREAAAMIARGLEDPASGRLEYIRRASADEPVFWGGAEAFFETHKQRLIHPDLRRRLGAVNSASVILGYFHEFTQATECHDPLNWMTFLDLKLRLPELLLMRVDKMTMATSVEARVPFLDHQLVEYVMSIPQSVKVPQYQTKYLLKKAVHGLIPDEIIRRPKQGFAVPVSEWFERELGERIRSKLTTFCREHAWLDGQEVQKVLDRKNSQLPWYLFNFVLWHETWIEQKDAISALLPATRG